MAADVFSDLELALPFIRVWDDCDLPEIHYYRVFARCGIHGTIQSTWDTQPKDNAKLICGQCRDQIRRCPIFAFTEQERP